MFFKFLNVFFYFSSKRLYVCIFIITNHVKILIYIQRYDVSYLKILFSSFLVVFVMRLGLRPVSGGKLHN